MLCFFPFLSPCIDYIQNKNISFFFYELYNNEKKSEFSFILNDSKSFIASIIKPCMAEQKMLALGGGREWRPYDVTQQPAVHIWAACS